MRNPPIRPGFWRGVNVNQNTIYMECFLDEMAHAAGRDALDFRLAPMKNHPKSAAGAQGCGGAGGWGSNDGKAGGCIFNSLAATSAACAREALTTTGSCPWIVSSLQLTVAQQ